MISAKNPIFHQKMLRTVVRTVKNQNLILLITRELVGVEQKISRRWIRLGLSFKMRN